MNGLAFRCSVFGENMEFSLRRHLLSGDSDERIAHVLFASKNHRVHASHFAAEDGCLRYGKPSVRASAKLLPKVRALERRVELGFVNYGGTASPCPTNLVRPPSNTAIIPSSRINDARNIEILPRRRTREEVEAYHAHVAFDVASAREEVKLRRKQLIHISITSSRAREA
jgi:hypothetical protein